ncbi:hypothetical protein BDW22DRAFT_445835 [Trametopsis cervina]|nr:hypothetical protein BDW22DRAFT_445835 [Trametopsis cervina]
MREIVVGVFDKQMERDDWRRKESRVVEEDSEHGVGGRKELWRGAWRERKSAGTERGLVITRPQNTQQQTSAQSPAAARRPARLSLLNHIVLSSFARVCAACAAVDSDRRVPPTQDAQPSTSARSKRDLAKAMQSILLATLQLRMHSTPVSPLHNADIFCYGAANSNLCYKWSWLLCAHAPIS